MREYGFTRKLQREGEGSSVAIVDWWIPKLKQKKEKKRYLSSAMDGDSWTRGYLNKITSQRLHYIDNKQTRDEQFDTCVIEMMGQVTNIFLTN